MITFTWLYSNVSDLEQSRLTFIKLLNYAFASGCNEYAIPLGHSPEYTLPPMSLGLVQNKSCSLKNFKHGRVCLGTYFELETTVHNSM